jgi:hypothetical protein
VLVSLAIIVLVAIAIRPFIVKPARSRHKNGPTEPTPPVNLPDLGTPTHRGSIIPFPTSTASEPTDPAQSWTAADPAVAQRLERVIGETSRRRKLGDRHPTQLSRELSAAMHRTAPEAFAPREMAFDQPAPLPRRRLDDDPAATWPNRTPRPLAFEPVATKKGLAPVPAAGRDGTMPAAVDEHEPGPGLELDAAMAAPISGDEASSGEKLSGVDLDELLREPASPETAEGDAVVDEVAEGVDLDDAGPDAGHEEEQTVVSAIDLESPVARTEVSVLAPAGDEIEERTLAALHQVVRDLLYSANSGELLHGFALYSDPFLFRFMDDSGMSEEEFREFFDAMGARPADQWDHLDQLSDLTLLPDGRIEATATYVDGDGKPSNGVERYRFVEVDGHWMIDDIAPIG